MKLVSFLPSNVSRACLGAIVESANGETNVVDLTFAYASYLRDLESDPFAESIAAIRVPPDMKRFLEGGTRSLDAAQKGLKYVQSVREGAAGLVGAGVSYKLSSVKLLAPLSRPGKIISVGGNYLKHVQEGRETGLLSELPSYPVAFLKMPSSIIGPEDEIVRSRHTEELDYEVELSIVIGKKCKHLTRDNWRHAVAGFTIVNDISMRDLIVQEKAIGSILQGKSLDTTCPVGPCLVTTDEIENPDALDLSLRVNGKIRQADNTSSMTFSCGDILSYWSSRLTLEPGDIITTGSPGGNAGFNKRYPDRLLKAGDIIEAEIQGIGILRNRVIDEQPYTA